MKVQALSSLEARLVLLPSRLPVRKLQRKPRMTTTYKHWIPISYRAQKYLGPVQVEATHCRYICKKISNEGTSTKHNCRLESYCLLVDYWYGSYKGSHR
jgi:hypothetical protein